MDSRQVGLGAIMLLLSSAVMLQAGLVDARLPIALAGVTSLGVAAGAVVAAARGRPERA